MKVAASSTSFTSDVMDVMQFVYFVHFYAANDGGHILGSSNFSIYFM